MLAPTHRSFATASAGASLLVLSQVTDIFAETEPMSLITQSVIIMVVSFLTATLPDYDRMIPFIRHRGITHAIWIPAAIFYFLWQNLGEPYVFPALLGLFIGYTSHIVGDAFSTAGIAWFYPIQQYSGPPTGAFWVKGFRGPFLPLYSVGSPAIIKPTIIWYGITALTLFIYIKSVFF